MCLILFSLDRHPTYKLVIAANRDEFFDRKTSEAHFWKDAPDIVGGRDLEAHGTWMAMTRAGRISMVTNYRDPANIRADAPSRGKLVTDYLLSAKNPREFLEDLRPGAASYNGFNLLVGNPEELWYLSNYQDGIHPVTKGVHGLSNHLLETPWPKVTRGKEQLSTLLTQDSIDPESLFEMLYDEMPAMENQLPDTGIGRERERALSSMFIKTPGYGTRCSTVVLVTHGNDVTYAERVYDLSTYAHSLQSFKFTIG